MNIDKFIRALPLALFTLVAACGGGSGGEAGAPPFGGGGGGSGGGTGGGATALPSISLQVQRAGVATNSISSTETVQAVATVRNASGGAVEGVVVSFTESGPSLLKLAPISGTALTDANGLARVDVVGSNPASTGATTVVAAASVAGESVSADRAIQVSASGGTGATPVPAAVNFVAAVPSGVAIVIKGAGGTGRSESAILTFKVVDGQGAPIKDAGLSFTINPNNGGAAIAPTNGVTDANGLASTTVSSGTQPASIVVTASTAGAGGAVISSQSSTLIVSNSVPVAGGFEIVAEKYNLDGNFTGDSTTVTAFVRDAFGNPVADGVAVNFTTNFGVIATSTQGGCTTVNGRCTVTFTVQEPRGNGLATVVGQINVGNTTTLTDSININMAGAVTNYISLTAVDPPTPLTAVTLVGACKGDRTVFLTDGSGRAAAAGTTISVVPTLGVTGTIANGSPVEDSLSLAPTDFQLTLDLTSQDLVPRCVATGTNTATKEIALGYRTPNRVGFRQAVLVRYPTN